MLAMVLIVSACSDNPAGTSADPGTEPGGSAAPTDPGSSAPGATSGEPVDQGGLACWSGEAAGGTETVSFSDATETMGLVTPLVGMHGHAAVWGDYDANDQLDLFVGTFADRDATAYQVRGASGPSPDRLLINNGGGFAAAPGFPEMFTRTSGGAVGDFDNDGDMDLVVSRNYDDDTPDAPSTQVFRNDDGALAAAGSGLPTQFGGRAVGVLDFDSDGLMDLFITEDRFTGGSSVLLRNTGNLVFEDVTASVGIPPDVHGLGVVIADFNGDRHQDIFVSGSNRMFVSAEGAFREVDGSVFRWAFYGEEDDIAGASAADVNRDGLLDLLVGQHFNSTLDGGVLVPVRLYLNRGPDDTGSPRFEDVTEAAGLVGLPTKAPHVELNDIDNDGWPDVVTTASAAGGTQPAVFRHTGLEGDIPKFATPEGLGSPQYWVAGPTADVDHDGRLDLFLVEWEPSLPSLLLRNETASGNWLDVSVGPDLGYGIGWRVEIYGEGSAGDLAALLGAREITVTQGYSAGVAPVAHFGLGDTPAVDVRLIPTGDGEVIEATGVAANQHLRFPNGC